MDEYESVYTCSPGRTRRPLTLGQLIRLIDTASRDHDEEEAAIFYAREWGVTDGGEDPEDYRHFYRVTSAFHPDLERWYTTHQASPNE